MRAVGRNIRRDRVANILNGIERRGSSKERLWLRSSPFGCFWRASGSRGHDLATCGREELSSLTNSPTSQHHSASEISPPAKCLPAKQGQQAAPDCPPIKPQGAQCDPLVCASCCVCSEREDPSRNCLPHLSPSSDHSLTTTPSINPPAPLKPPRPVSLYTRPTCPTTTAFPSPSSSSQVRLARAAARKFPRQKNMA